MGDQKKRERYIFPEGYYRMEVIGNTITESQASGKPYVVINAKVLEFKKNKQGTTPVVKLGLNRQVSLFLSEKKIEDTKKFLLAAGFTGKSLAVLDAGHPNHQSLAGYKFDALNKPEKNQNGELYDKFSVFGDGNSAADPNAWMNKLPQTNSSKLMQYDPLFGAVKVDSPVSAPAASAKQGKADDEGPELPPWDPTDEGW